MLSPEADIILACHKLHDEVKISTNLEWLHTHQDKDKHKEDLPPPVQMNIDMDVSCKNEWTRNIVINSNNENFATPYPGGGAMLIINGKWVTMKYASQIQDAVMANDHLNFSLKKIQG